MIEIRTTNKVGWRLIWRLGTDGYWHLHSRNGKPFKRKYWTLEFDRNNCELETYT